ncbi:glycosyltransferase family 2 protein [Marinobacterium sp. CAU 1594]|nr:glycosyltransferase family 2 protein [Marinobacterium arenosum]
MAFAPVVLIPVYNHEEAIGPTLEDVLQYSCPVLLVDDGSSPACRDVLVALSEKYADRVELLRLPRNGGKGAAVKAGFEALLARGYSHAIQVDADGQHDLSDLPMFLAAGRENPEALVTGYPKYDTSVPKIRYYGRYLTHVWVWINTLSFEVRDTMCGYRVYPLAQVVKLLKQEQCGDRMDFDTEVIVRWLWRGGRVKNLPTEVRYPIDGVSHFDALRDNVLISLMHTRLFFGMLRRVPSILWRRLHG